MENPTEMPGLSITRRKKSYFKPVIQKICIDPSFTLMYSSNTGPELPPRPKGTVSGEKENDSPFQRPFNDKPFE